MSLGIFDPYFVTLRHDRGTLILFPRIDGFREFVPRMRNHNRGIVTRGL